MSEVTTDDQGRPCWEMCERDCDTMERAAIAVEDLTTGSEQLRVRIAHLEADLGRANRESSQLEELWLDRERKLIQDKLRLTAENQRLRADGERLKQFIEEVYADPWLTPNIWANLDAALDGEWLYQKLPGWDESKPGQKPKEG
ncbi:MAG TPA: hypothetical protein VK641_14190 [Terriglobales bacterium]|nr:hypothetical protein [Terriglobales bacterium]